MHLARIWNAHYATPQFGQVISQNIFDACVISKPFFNAQDLLIAEDDTGPVGFVHIGYGGASDLSTIDHQAGLICALCIVPHQYEDRIAEDLLRMALKRLDNQGARDVVAMGSQNRYAFYIGMAPGDCLMGVVAYDRRLQRWLSGVGFQGTTPTENWELDLATFRPPMDRGQIAVRRLASIGRILDDVQNEWWNAVVLGHTEQIRFHLSNRAQGTITEEVFFWHTDPAWSGISSSIARVWLPPIPGEGEPRDRTVYLLCEAFRQLQMERFAKIRAIAFPEDLVSVSVLEKLSFRSVDQGIIYMRKLG